MIWLTYYFVLFYLTTNIRVFLGAAVMKHYRVSSNNVNHQSTVKGPYAQSPMYGRAMFLSWLLGEHFSAHVLGVPSFLLVNLVYLQCHFSSSDGYFFSSVFLCFNTVFFSLCSLHLIIRTILTRLVIPISLSLTLFLTQSFFFSFFAILFIHLSVYLFWNSFNAVGSLSVS